MISSRIKNPDLASQIDEGQVAWFKFISPITGHYAQEVSRRDYRGKKLAYWGHITGQNTILIMSALKQAGAEFHVECQSANHLAVIPLRGG